MNDMHTIAQDSKACVNSMFSEVFPDMIPEAQRTILKRSEECATYKPQYIVTRIKGSLYVGSPCTYSTTFSARLGPIQYNKESSTKGPSTVSGNPWRFTHPEYTAAVDPEIILICL
jgi:hypothetical protein